VLLELKAFKGNGERLVQSHAEGISNHNSLFLLLSMEIQKAITNSFASSSQRRVSLEEEESYDK
jgi:hypothetical protein